METVMDPIGETINPRIKKEYAKSKENFDLLKKGITVDGVKIILQI